ncbi:hypothetical protein BJX96DRAFT_157765 [Aspergillus floccosus]
MLLSPVFKTFPLYPLCFSLLIFRCSHIRTCNFHFLIMKPFFPLLLLAAVITTSSAALCYDDPVVIGDIEFSGRQESKNHECHKGQGTRLGDMDGNDTSHCKDMNKINNI